MQPWARWFAWAGIVYTAVWLIGLVIAPAAPDAFGSASTINGYFVAHRSAAMIQSVFVHGLAGVALVAFAVALWSYLPHDANLALPRRLMMVSGLLAAAVSFLQVALMIGIYVNVGRHGSADGTRTLFSAINKADTIKLILLAVFVGAVSYAASQVPALPRWVVWTGAATAIFLVVGGLAFVINSGVLNAALDISLLLLLLWAAATSVSMMGRRSRAQHV